MSLKKRRRKKRRRKKERERKEARLSLSKRRVVSSSSKRERTHSQQEEREALRFFWLFSERSKREQTSAMMAGISFALAAARLASTSMDIFVCPSPPDRFFFCFDDKPASFSPQDNASFLFIITALSLLDSVGTRSEQIGRSIASTHHFLHAARAAARAALTATSRREAVALTRWRRAATGCAQRENEQKQKETPLLAPLNCN